MDIQYLDNVMATLKSARYVIMAASRWDGWSHVNVHYKCVSLFTLACALGSEHTRTCFLNIEWLVEQLLTRLVSVVRSGGAKCRRRDACECREFHY